MVSRSKAHESLLKATFQLLFYGDYEHRPSVLKIFKSCFKIDDKELTAEEKANYDLYKSIFLTVCKKGNEYAIFLSEHLKKWDFERLCLTDQALLLLSYVEYKDFSIEKGIVINNAITLSKKYSAKEEDYKYINAVLDKVLR